MINGFNKWPNFVAGQSWWLAVMAMRATILNSYSKISYSQK